MSECECECVREGGGGGSSPGSSQRRLAPKIGVSKQPNLIDSNGILFFYVADTTKKISLRLPPVAM